MTANPWRGEVSITLDGISYVMRPTFERLNRIEQKLNMGFVALARKLADGNIMLEELAVVVAECMQEKIAVRDALTHGGIMEAIASVSAMFALVFGGFDEITRR